MPDLDFTIKTTAELAGAEQAAESLERLIGKQKSLGEDYSENAAKLAKINGSLDEYRKSSHAGADSIEIFNTHQREMNRLFVEADRLLPGLGEVLRAAFRPETLGIAATVLLIQEIVKWIGEAKKAAEELQQAEDKLAIDAWQNQQKAAGEAASAAQEYANKIGVIRTALDGLKTAQDGQKAILDAQIAQENALTEAIKKRSMAVIESNAALSPEQKRAAAAQVNAAFDDKRSADALKHERQQIDLQEQTYQKAIDLWQPAADASDPAQKAYQDALKIPRAANLQAENEKVKATLPDLKKAMAKAVAGMPDLGGLSAADRAKVLSNDDIPYQDWIDAKQSRGVDLQKMQDQRKAVDAATKAYHDAQSFIEANNKIISDTTAHLADLRNKAESAAKNFTDIDKATTDFYNAIETAKKVLQIHTDTAAQLTPITAATRAAEISAGVQNSDIGPAVKTADSVVAGKKVSAAEGAQLVALAELITNHAQTLSSAAQILEAAKNNPAQMQALLDRILAIIQRMSGGLVAFDERLAKIEQQVAGIGGTYGLPN
jgi:hypothetical protein